jgi:hypothetical protein
MKRDDAVSFREIRPFVAVASTNRMKAQARARPSVGGQPSLGTLSRVSIVQTVLVYAAIPAAIYGLVALLTLRGKSVRSPRYRPGQPWDYAPVWWTANPAGADASAVPTGGGKARRTAKGGARGSW